MKFIRIVFAICVCFLAAVAAIAAPKVVFVRCGKLIFDAEKSPMTNADVIITDGKITAVGTGLSAPAGAEQVDLSNFTVLPGLIDAHIHIWSGPRESNSSEGLEALRAQKAMNYALESGIAAVRVLGTSDFLDVALRDAIDEGTIPGPHMIPAGHAISIPAGHGDHFTYPAKIPLTDYYTPLNGFIDSPDDAEKAVHLQLKYGAGVIKILASGGVLSPLDSPDAEQVSPEELRRIVETAHMLRVKVAAHCENLETILAALHAGVDSIEHGPGLNQEAVNLMKSLHTSYVPTVYIVDNILLHGTELHMQEYSLRKAHEIGEKEFAAFKLALANGVFIAAGSDQSYEPGQGTVRDEAITEVKYGMTPQQALVAATKHSAELIGLDALLGTVAIGKEGDLVAVEGDPLTDIHALERVRAVVYQGRSVTPANRK
ncbi:MAG TPA: amidohydrolase family protein [Candidatus Acidoferrales bacterium]